MTKRTIIWIFSLVAVAGLGTFFYLWLQPPTWHNGVSKEEIADQIKQVGGGSAIPSAAPAVALDPKRPVHLAIGSLGQGDDEQNGHLEDLVLAGLTGAQRLELVERHSLEAALHEMNLSLSGLVRTVEPLVSDQRLRSIRAADKSDGAGCRGLEPDHLRL